MPAKKPHKCRECNENNPDNFYKGQKSICKRCYSARYNKKYHEMSKVEKQKYKANCAKNYTQWVKDNSLQFRLKSAYHRAYRKGIVFDLSLKDLQQIYDHQQGKCFYSGVEMDVCGEGANSVSVDRKDSSIGYVVDNVVLCTAHVNVIKREYGIDEFLQLIELIYAHSVKNRESNFSGD